MRAMSLAAEDSEGEQNEIRSLQQQLDQTTKLVQKLSGQLTELKEQVHGVLPPDVFTVARKCKCLILYEKTIANNST